VIDASHGDHRDPLALQVTDRPDSLASDELEAAPVEPHQADDRSPTIERGDQVGGEDRLHVCLPRDHRLDPDAVIGRHSLDVAHIGKSLAPQQLLGDEHRRIAYH